MYCLGSRDLYVRTLVITKLLCTQCKTLCCVWIQQITTDVVTTWRHRQTSKIGLCLLRVILGWVGDPLCFGCLLTIYLLKRGCVNWCEYDHATLFAIENLADITLSQIHWHTFGRICWCLSRLYGVFCSTLISQFCIALLPPIRESLMYT